MFGFTGVTVIAEVCHHLMIAEAIQKKWVSLKKPTVQLQEKPEIVKKLSEYFGQLLNIMDWGIRVITPPEDMIIKSQVFRSQYGFLTNDSFIPVYMKLANINKLATNDKALARISSIEVYFPSDGQ